MPLPTARIPRYLVPILGHDVKIDYSHEFAQLVGSDIRWNAEFFGVSEKTLGNWMSGKTAVPFLAMKLARFAYTGQLSALYGNEWDCITVDRFGLTLPGWRRQFGAGELRRHFWDHQARYNLIFKVQQLERDVQRRDEQINELERQLAFYKRQVRLEAGLGMMLCRLTDYG